MDLNIPGLRRESELFYFVPRRPRDSLCLRCSQDVDDEAVPYYKQLHENGVDYFLCWDCMPSEEQAEIIEWEATIPGEDRLLS